jgi:hypothetical protein
MLPAVEQYLNKLSPDLHAVAMRLREIILSTIEVEERLSYTVPFYYGRSRVCYLNARKSVLDLGFCRGYEMQDMGLLEVKGRAEVRTIEFKSIDDIDEDSIKELLLEASRLDKLRSKRKSAVKQSRVDSAAP